MAERLSVLLLGFGSFFILVRTLTKEEYGIWSLFLSITTLIELARNGLIQNALIKHLATADDDTSKQIITSSLVLNVILTVISVCALLFLSPLLAEWWHTPVLVPMFRYYVLTTIALIFFSQFNFVQQAKMDFKGVFFSNLIRQALFFAYVLYFFIAGKNMDLVQMVNFQTACAIVGACSSIFFVRSYISFDKKISWMWVSQLFHYGKYVFGTSVSGVLLKTADQMLLGNLRTVAEVGSYNAAARISNLFEVPVNSISIVVFPQSSKRIHTEGMHVVKDLYEKSVAAMLSIVVPGVIFVCLIPKLVLLIMTGSEYTDMSFILQLIVIQNLFLPYLRQFGTIMDAVGYPQANFYLIVVNAVLNVGVNYVMISLYGIEGAAWGSLIVFGIFTTFVISFMKRKFDISMSNTFRYTLAFYPQIWQMLLSKVRKSK